MVGGSQTVNIYNWTWRFIIAHELGHALGFWHEQSRSDRDSFVQINWGNIESGKAYNFDRHDEASHFGPYDFDSVMHYSQDSFSTNGLPTITVLPPNQAWQNLIGQRDHFSTLDSMIMSYLYPQSDWRFVDPYYSGTEAGTFLNPYTAFASAEASVPVGGKVVLLQPGTYTATGHHSKAMTLVAPQGGVVLR
jgi:hypothetical protein